MLPFDLRPIVRKSLTWQSKYTHAYNFLFVGHFLLYNGDNSPNFRLSGKRHWSVLTLMRSLADLVIFHSFRCIFSGLSSIPLLQTYGRTSLVNLTADSEDEQHSADQAILYNAYSWLGKSANDFTNVLTVSSFAIFITSYSISRKIFASLLL